MSNEVKCPGGYAKIDAKCKANATGFTLEQGKTYYFVAEGKWLDAGIECDADGYEKKHLNPLRWARRINEAHWFQLIGEVNGATVLLGKQGSFGAPASGELICYANDAPLMRWNNKGAICLKVQEFPIAD